MCPIQQTVYHGSDQVANPHSAKREPARQAADAIRQARRTAYLSLVASLRRGAQFPKQTIEMILIQANREFEHLVQDVLVSDRPTPQPGDRCEKEDCDGRLRVASTRRLGDKAVQYLECNTCRHRPANNKREVPGTLISRRGRRRGSVLS